MGIHKWQKKTEEKCFEKCNERFTPMLNPKRAYCKKGCQGDEDIIDECYSGTCSNVCIKAKIGADEEKASEWTKFFSRAPADPKNCLEACLYGCQNSKDK